MLDKLYPLHKRAGLALVAALFFLLVGISSRHPMWVLTRSGWIKIEYHPCILWVSAILAVISLGIAAYYGYRHTRLINETAHDMASFITKSDELTHKMSETPWYATEEGIRDRYPNIRKDDLQ